MAKIAIEIEDDVLQACQMVAEVDHILKGMRSGKDLLRELIKSIANGKEIKQGKWIEQHNDALGICLQDQLECSICGKWQCGRYQPYRSFCPNCGADMRGDTDEYSKLE